MNAVQGLMRDSGLSGLMGAASLAPKLCWFSTGFRKRR